MDTAEKISVLRRKKRLCNVVCFIGLYQRILEWLDVKNERPVKIVKISPAHPRRDYISGGLTPVADTKLLTHRLKRRESFPTDIHWYTEKNQCALDRSSGQSDV